MSDEKKQWFENWFDTPYYHILYKKRDHSEAASFIDALIHYLNPPKTANFLDLASGKGRHSIYLNNKGFDVTGLDLSPNSIKCANKFASENLRFLEHDMRKPLRGLSFDYVFNLFTSLGYFETEAEDVEVLKNVKHILNPQGVFVLDFFNSLKPNTGFDTHFIKTIENVQFEIFKHLKNDIIIKTIKVTDQDKTFYFEEKVRNYNVNQFKQMFHAVGLTVIDTFGTYDLAPFVPENSERLILIAKHLHD